MICGAEISECGLYRYTLYRIWDKSLPVLVFVMLNPSTADALTDDRTVSKCIWFGQRDGYGRIFIVNLFAFRTKSPKILMQATDPVGPHNMARVSLACIAGRVAGQVVLAWGSSLPKGTTQHEKLTGFLSSIHIPIYCLGVNDDGQPKHPLYLPKDQKIVRFR